MNACSGRSWLALDRDVDGLLQPSRQKRLLNMRAARKRLRQRVSRIAGDEHEGQAALVDDFGDRIYARACARTQFAIRPPAAAETAVRPAPHAMSGTTMDQLQGLISAMLVSSYVA